VKKSLSTKIACSALLAVAVIGSTVMAATVGTIDPAGAGNYKAAFLDTSVVSDTSINFGKFSTESQYNITVTDTEIRGYAWGASVGYIVTNCANTASGCVPANGSFKIANNAGVLSGYAWGENTGWINFGPFTDPGISTVKIGTDGNFGGTLGSAGYAWSQNYGWIKFDCSSNATCVNTDWAASTGGNTGGNNGGTSGGGAPGGGTTTPVTPTTPTTPTTPATPANPTTPSNPATPTTPTNPSQPETPPDTGGEPEVPPATTPTQPTDTPPSSPTDESLFPNGLQLPPSFIEAANNIYQNITRAIEGIGNIVEPIVRKVVTASQAPAAVAASKVTAAVGIVTTAASAVSLLLLANPFSFVEFFLLPFRLWSLLLVFFGLKKKARPWGTVYDSVTKQPIDPAYVMLTDMDGNEVATSITDIDGRYGFSVGPGTYKIVANKTNYEYPSKKLAGRVGDELYNNLYFGDVLVIKEEGEIIAKNIPLDQLNFDWNEFAKNEQKRLSYFRRSDVLIARVANVFFWLGFAVSTFSLIASHTLYNKIVFVIYGIMFLIRHYSPQFKPKGAVTDAMTHEPMPFAIVHLISAATGQEITHKVANRLGYYYGLVPNGTYNIVIDRKNPDATYTKIPVPTVVTVKDGYLKTNFTV
jgi:hypothetical protein